MACIIKVGNKFENLSGYNTFITDKEINSQYFRINYMSYKERTLTETYSQSNLLNILEEILFHKNKETYSLQL